MAEEQEEQDPSIEEILDSIRQIISDDDEEGAGGAEEASAAAPEPESESEPVAPAAPEPAPEAAVSDPEPEPDDLIELTDKIEDEAAPEPEPAPEPAPEPEPEPEPIEVDMQDSEPEPEAEPAAPATDKAAADLDALLTSTAESAAYEGFAELARKTAIEGGGITVEEIVRTELRPLLRNWLDRHLPSMIERLVQDELDRIAKRAVDD